MRLSGSIDPQASIAGQTESSPYPMSLLDWNWDQLNHIADNDSDFALELLNLFLQDSQMQLQDLKTAIARLDFSKIEGIAHHLKGASANVGAIAMQHIASDLEQQARHNHLNQGHQALADLELHVNSIHTFLQSISSTTL